MYVLLLLHKKIKTPAYDPKFVFKSVYSLSVAYFAWKCHFILSFNFYFYFKEFQAYGMGWKKELAVNIS
jgi:hypothetical protein